MDYCSTPVGSHWHYMANILHRKLMVIMKIQCSIVCLHLPSLCFIYSTLGLAFCVNWLFPGYFVPEAFFTNETSVIATEATHDWSGCGSIKDPRDKVQKATLLVAGCSPGGHKTVPTPHPWCIPVMWYHRVPRPLYTARFPTWHYFRHNHYRHHHNHRNVFWANVFSTVVVVLILKICSIIRYTAYI